MTPLLRRRLILGATGAQSLAGGSRITLVPMDLEKVHVRHDQRGEKQHEIFAGVGGFSGSRFDVGSPGTVSRVPGAMVTGGYYQTLGLNPVVGRLLTHADDERGAPLVAVISYGYWDRQFARSPATVGQVLLLNGVPVTIIGVSPRGFVGANVGSIADLTLPVAALPQIRPDAAALLAPGNFWLRVLARLHAGVSVPEAEARLAAAWPQISEPVIASHWPAWWNRCCSD